VIFIQIIKSFISWVGGKTKLLWLIHKLFPNSYTRYVEVFGGGASVLFSRAPDQNCLEVYNDYNGDLVNLFYCVKNRTLALILELGFLPLNARDDFNVLVKQFHMEEFTEDYLNEELEIAERCLTPPQYEEIKSILLERAKRGDVKRAADYYKLIRYSFSSNTKSFGGKGCDIRKFFYLIWECSRRLAHVVIENKDFEDVIEQYARPDSLIYCDPPYFNAEDCYVVEFPKEDHIRLHDALLKCPGFVMVSYNYCPFICELYKEFYIFYTTRQNNMSPFPGSEYEEVIMTNYDPRVYRKNTGIQLTLFSPGDFDEDVGKYKLIHEPCPKDIECGGDFIDRN